jgi:hypothetical protein
MTLPLGEEAPFEVHRGLAVPRGLAAPDPTLRQEGAEDERGSHQDEGCGDGGDHDIAHLLESKAPLIHSSVHTPNRLAGMLPSPRKIATSRFTERWRLCCTEPTIFVAVAKTMSVPIAVGAGTCMTTMRNGVISEPPPPL